MNILIVAARLCWPLNTGAKIRAYHLLRTLNQVHQVTLVTYYGDSEEQAHFSHFRNLGITLVPVFNPDIDKKLNFTAICRAMLSGLPLTVAKYHNKAMISALTSLALKKIDVIHCEHLHMSPMVPPGKSCFVLDAHNVESQIAGRYATAETSLSKKSLLNWNYKRFEKFEMDVVRKSNLVLAVSEEDRQTFLSLGADDNIQTLENGVDIDFFQPGEHEEGESLVFVGSMDWKPNIGGVDYFLDEILPLIRKSHPSVTVTIVGKDPLPKLMDRVATQETGVIVTGTVPDVRPFVEKAAVCIVPLKVGGGTRLKVLEGFSMGKAVVSTTLGCEGIECVDGEHLLIADDPESFAHAVTTLLENEELRRKLGTNARSLAEEKYSWDALGKKLLGYYDELFARGN
ncbi:glycosyltransferase [Pelotalea chapellei]|uniref:Glycosyltransferase n=1 Tax=Pelotalea chapellei TaxID=44671 RepID=A0ABS5U5E8_9BACT|nr:glycosyltransferase [Pelotalea chapellei]MBT1070886.1 glycosyltransferase [Pelotalea chapellei]